jgi:hypothetical protein
LGMTPLPAKVCCWHVAFTRHIFNYVLRPFAALALGDQSMILGWKRWVLGAGSPEERLASTPKSGSSWNYPWDSTKSASLAVSFNDTTKAWLAWKMTYYIILHHITSHYIILHNIRSYYIILHHITLFATHFHSWSFKIFLIDLKIQPFTSPVVHGWGSQTPRRLAKDDVVRTRWWINGGHKILLMAQLNDK